MDEAIKYISKIEIKGLWGRYDLEWNLHPDVNVLSGVNGSGKSTILRYLYEVIGYQRMPDKNLFNKIKKIVITFNTKEVITYEYDVEKIDYDKKNKSNKLNDKLSDLSSTYKLLFKFHVSETDDIRFLCWKSTPNLLDEKLKSFPIKLVKTDDNELITAELAQKFDKNIRTHLDYLIYLLQKDYLNYQIDIGRRALQLNGSGSEEKRREIDYFRRRFIKILNGIFGETDKKVNETKNEIVFQISNKSVSAYSLSSGEKQTLIVLLSALVQDNQPAILLLDEPEVSIHFDVQKKLIDYIRELNPNVQIILATHSPAIIMDGWMDKVKEIRDLIVSDNQEAVLENAE